MENIKEFEKVVEAWENYNFVWFVNAKNTYNKYNDLYVNEGKDVSTWSEDHIRIQNYLRNGYAKDKGLTQRDYDKVKGYTVEKYRTYLSIEADNKLVDIIKRVKAITGDIEVAELVAFDTSNVAEIQVKGIWSDALVTTRYKEVNGQLKMKTHIKETRRFF